MSISTHRIAEPTRPRVMPLTSVEAIVCRWCAERMVALDCPVCRAASIAQAHRDRQEEIRQMVGMVVLVVLVLFGLFHLAAILGWLPS